MPKEPADGALGTLFGAGFFALAPEDIFGAEPEIFNPSSYCFTAYSVKSTLYSICLIGRYLKNLSAQSGWVRRGALRGGELPVGFSLRRMNFFPRLTV
ncbi:MAG: hypothetical protein HY280_01095 [Nitrospinae bacterium]|nr:hypothetical protein [Nitrospinota bacterium]